MVEDNQSDVFLIREAIEAAKVNAELQVLSDGDKAARYFDEIDRQQAAECPALVIMDINLPKKHGDEVLRHLRASRRCRDTAVLVVTSSNSAQDRDGMARLGISGYFRKPSDYEEFMKLGDVVRAVLG